jgi:cytoskeletal protein CcmA (bactofilin family)
MTITMAQPAIQFTVPAVRKSRSANITTPSVVIHEGVVFEGHCSMGGGAEAKLEKTDKKVALYPKEERLSNTLRLPTEAVNK